MSTAEIRRPLQARKWALFSQIFRSLLASQVLRISRAPVHFKTIRCLAVMLLRCKRTVENLPGRKQTPLVDHKLSLQHYFLKDQTWCVFAVLTFANSPEEKLAISTIGKRLSCTFLQQLKKKLKKALRKEMASKRLKSSAMLSAFRRLVVKQNARP